MNTRETLAQATLLPELRLTDAQLAVPLARALYAGGIRALEVSVRAPAGLACIEALRAAFPQAIIGASGLSRAVDFAAAGRLAVSFGSSPGFTAEIAAAARGARFPLLPGVMTPSDVIAARAVGFHDMKLFPVAAAGGVKIIRMMTEEFPDERFSVAGLLDQAEAADYLRLPRVLCVHAPWLTPDALVTAARWADIESLARDALAQTIRSQGHAEGA